jgi:hypothetical protein
VLRRYPISFPVIQAVSTTVEETAHLATDVITGTRYAGKMYKLGMQSAYKTQLAESFLEQNELASNEKLSDVQRDLIAQA